jgi:hypothetical protein
MSGGVATALGAAVEQLPEGEDLVQAALFGDLTEDETGALDAPSPLSQAIEPRRRGGGRKPGSRNRRTEATAAWLLSQHRHPVLVMMEAYSMAPAELAARIGLRQVLLSAKGEPEVWGFEDGTLIELLKLQLRMAEACAPYVAQKLPQAVQVSAEGAVQVTFAGVSLPARGGAPGGGEVIEGEAMSVRLPFKSDAASRTDD